MTKKKVYNIDTRSVRRGDTIGVFLGDFVGVVGIGNLGGLGGIANLVGVDGIANLGGVDVIANLGGVAGVGVDVNTQAFEDGELGWMLGAGCMGVIVPFDDVTMRFNG